MGNGRCCVINTNLIGFCQNNLLFVADYRYFRNGLSSTSLDNIVFFLVQLFCGQLGYGTAHFVSEMMRQQYVCSSPLCSVLYVCISSNLIKTTNIGHCSAQPSLRTHISTQRMKSKQQCLPTSSSVCPKQHRSVVRVCAYLCSTAKRDEQQPCGQVLCC